MSILDDRFSRHKILTAAIANIPPIYPLCAESAAFPTPTVLRRKGSAAPIHDTSAVRPGSHTDGRVSVPAGGSFLTDDIGETHAR